MGALKIFQEKLFIAVSQVVRSIDNISGNGIFIIDDGYIDGNSDFRNPLILNFKSIIRQINLAGMQLIENDVATKKEVKESDDYIFENIKKKM